MYVLYVSSISDFTFVCVAINLRSYYIYIYTYIHIPIPLQLYVLIYVHLRPLPPCCPVLYDPSTNYCGCLFVPCSGGENNLTPVQVPSPVTGKNNMA